MAIQKNKLHPGFLRNAKVILAIIGVAVIGVVVSIYAAKHRKDQPSQVDVPTVDAQGGTPAPETPHYQQALDTSNRQGLKEARLHDTTFIPALSDRNAQIEDQLKDRSDTTPVTATKIDYAHPNGDSQPQNDGQSTLPPLPPPSSGISTQMTALLNTWDNPVNSQQILGLQDQKGQATTQAAAAQPVTASAPDAASAPKQPIILALDQFGGHMENGIDTDAPSDVFAVIDQGPCKGAELTGSGKLTNEVVSASFTMMKCNGKTYSVNAIALNDETMMNALPADIDHRYGQRIVTPALLGALGTAGAVYSNAGSQITNSPLGGTTQITNPNPSIKQLAGAGTAGGITGMQSAIQQQVSAIPPIRGRVSAGISIIIKFKADVTSQ
jgi:hypothetical protein